VNGDAAQSVLDLFHGARLTPTQRRIAHCLVEHSAKAAYLSAAEVADLAGVSQPSVTRFAMALGYEGYPALRRRLRELTGDAPEASRRGQCHAARGAGRGRAPGPAARPARPAGRRRAGRRAADRRAGRCRCSGCGPPRRSAGYFGLLSRQRFIRTSAFSTPAALRCSTGSIRPARPAPMRCWPWCFRVTRASPWRRIAEAKRAGYAVVAITDSAVSPVAERADVVLPAAVGTQLVFDLHTGPMAMAMVLLQAMCDAAPEPAAAPAGGVRGDGRPAAHFHGIGRRRRCPRSGPRAAPRTRQRGGRKRPPSGC
jgi:hypothetical protein